MDLFAIKVLNESIDPPLHTSHNLWFDSPLLLSRLPPHCRHHKSHCAVLPPAWGNIITRSSSMIFSKKTNYRENCYIGAPKRKLKPFSARIVTRGLLKEEIYNSITRKEKLICDLSVQDE